MSRARVLGCGVVCLNPGSLLNTVDLTDLAGVREVVSGQECNKSQHSDSARGARLCVCSFLTFSHTIARHMHCACA